MLLKASVSEMTSEAKSVETTNAAPAKANPLSALAGLKRPAEVVKTQPVSPQPVPEPALPAQETSEPSLPDPADQEDADSDNDTEFDPSQLPPSLRLRYEHCQAYDARKQRHHGAILLHQVDKAFEAYFDDAEWLGKEFGLMLDGTEPTASIENLHSRNAIIEIVRKGRRVAVFHGPDEVESSTVYGPETEAGHAAPYLSTDEPRPGHLPSGSDGDGSAGAGDKDDKVAIQPLPAIAPPQPPRPAPGPIETLAKSADPLQLVAAAFQRTLAAKAKAEAVLKEYEAAAKALDDLLHGVAIAFAELEPMADSQASETDHAEANQTLPDPAKPDPEHNPEPDQAAAVTSPPKVPRTFPPHTLSLPTENVMVGDLGIPTGITSHLKAAGILTVKQLTERRFADGGRLTKIPRIGTAKAEAIDEALTEFFRQRDEWELSNG